MSEEASSRTGIWVLAALLAGMTVTGAAVYLAQSATPRSDTDSASETPRVGTKKQLTADAVEPVPTGPQFDTFRVEADGSMVIAGRAEPGQVIDIMLSGEAIERVTADATGSFVAFPFAGTSENPRQLSLVADPDGEAIVSDVNYIVAPIPGAMLAVGQAPRAPTVPVEDTAAALPSLAQNSAADVPTTSSVPELGAASATPTVPTVLQSTSDGVRVVQSANAPEIAANVALDTITYDPQGEVRLTGRAMGDGVVQIYLDNEPVTRSPVTPEGDWRIDLPDVDTGVYTLRIDELNTEGTVVSRLETPFKREEAEDVASVLAEETARDGFDVAVKTVQPGATLWAIAQENLGDGILYVEVFEANRDLIKDPDLIYPGQIFRMPEVTR